MLVCCCHGHWHSPHPRLYVLTTKFWTGWGHDRLWWWQPPPPYSGWYQTLSVSQCPHQQVHRYLGKDNGKDDRCTGCYLSPRCYHVVGVHTHTLPGTPPPRGLHHQAASSHTPHPCTDHTAGWHHGWWTCCLDNQSGIPGSVQPYISKKIAMGWRI